jgi:hypothetical protein
MYNVVLLYSVENRDGYWQNFFARNSKLRPENGGTGYRTQTTSRSRSGVISGQDSSAAAVPPSRSMSVTALPPVPVDEKTAAVRNDYDSNEDPSSDNITAGRRMEFFFLLTVFKKSEKASFMLCIRVLYSMVVKPKVAGPRISSEFAISANVTLCGFAIAE